MSKTNDLSDAYDKLDQLRELLEFENVKGKYERHLKILDDARNSLNRHLSAPKK